VIDSIVRSSRHQYGEKDVFAPRFSKNIVQTFHQLLQCDPEEKVSQYKFTVSSHVSKIDVEIFVLQ
jgi:hypothetical protein